MKYFQPTLVLILTLATLSSFGQKTPDNIEIKRNTLFIEVGGNAFFYSLNYDRQLKIADKWRLTGRVGFMCLTTFTDDWMLVGAPIEFSYLEELKIIFLKSVWGLLLFMIKLTLMTHVYL